MKKKNLILLGAGLLVFTLAAFVAGRLIAGQAFFDDGAYTFTQVFEDGSEVTFRIIDAPEKPGVEADTLGIYLSRQDNIITIGSGDELLSQWDVDENSGEVDFAVDYNGPQMEVVFNHTTKVFFDVTDFESAVPEDRDTKTVLDIQQKLSPASLEDIAPDSFLEIWGEISGNRIVADFVIVK